MQVVPLVQYLAYASTQTGHAVVRDMKPRSRGKRRPETSANPSSSDYIATRMDICDDDDSDSKPMKQ